MSLIKPVIKNALDKLGYDIRRSAKEIAPRETGLLDYACRELQAIEKSEDNASRSDVLKKLRSLGLSDFGLAALDSVLASGLAAGLPSAPVDVAGGPDSFLAASL